MKKIVALIMALAMMLSCTAFAEPTPLADYGTENTLVYEREVAYEAEAGDVDHLGNPTDGGRVPTGLAHVTSWAGEYVLAAAYISEDCIDEFELEDVEAGFYATIENAVFLKLEPAYDASANDPSGPLVDVANYFHAHCYDLKGTMTLPEDIDEEGYKVSNTWSEWNSVVRGNADGDFNFGPAKVNLKGEDDYLYWNALTGFEFDEDIIEEFEEFKYIGMNADGQIVIVACDGNIVTKPEKAVIYLAYIFNPVVAE